MPVRRPPRALALLLLAVGVSAAAEGTPPPGGTPASSDQVKLLVLELAPGNGVNSTLAGAVSESVVEAVTGLGYFKVTTPKDVQTLLGLERQKQMLGCTAEATSCMSELAGALGARFVLSGQLSRIGDTFQLSLQMLDSERAQNLGRALRFARTIEDLRSQLPYQVAEATGAPPPKAPSKVLPYGLIGLGTASLLTAGTLGMITFSQKQVLDRDLALGAQGDRAALQPLAYYQAQASALQTQQILAWSATGLGAALISAGIYWNAVIDAGPGVHVAMVPAANGVGLAGVFP